MLLFFLQNMLDFIFNFILKFISDTIGKIFIKAKINKFTTINNKLFTIFYKKAINLFFEILNLC